MRSIVVLALAAVAIATAITDVNAGERPNGPGAISFLVDGDVVCGAIGDMTEDPDTALFSYEQSTGNPIRPTEVRIGDEVLPGDLFNDVMLGVMELHYVASTFDDQTAPDPFCVRVEMEGNEVVAVVPDRASAIACGRPMQYGMPPWLGIADVAGDPAWSLALPPDLTGFGGNIIVAANVAGNALCAFGDAVSGEAYLSGVGDVTIAARTADTVTIANLVPGFDTFRLTAGSFVDDRLTPGTTACVETRGYGGADGRVEMRIVTDPRCSSAAPRVLPDVAMEPAAPIGPSLPLSLGLALVLGAIGLAMALRSSRRAT
jgi:hypothetical protein